MISADEFLNPATKIGFNFFTGVPCSFLTPIINRVISDKKINYLPATSEGEAVAIAAGAWLAGKKTVVMCQNSGLGNTVNPLTSLNYPFKIPTLLIVTWRGQPGLKDEPQHELMGEITPQLLNDLKIPYELFPTDSSSIHKVILKAKTYMEKTSLPFALLMQKGSVIDDGLESPPTKTKLSSQKAKITFDNIELSREEALRLSLQYTPEESAIIATTGKTGRELFTILDQPKNFYTVGSMGCASAIGLGLSVNTKKPVMVIDGDGAALMKMGNIATIGYHRPKNFVHLLMDNGTHDSTGGQKTVSDNIEFSEIAISCGYSSGRKCYSKKCLHDALLYAFKYDGPHMIHLKTHTGSMSNLGRPTIKPDTIARRFKNFINKKSLNS